MKQFMTSALEIIANTKIKIGGADNQVNIPTIAADQTSINSILNTVYLWAGIVAVIVVVVAGMLYVFSNGDSANIQRAKNALLYGVIGLVVIMLAFTITQLVIYFAT